MAIDLDDATATTDGTSVVSKGEEIEVSGAFHPGADLVGRAFDAPNSGPRLRVVATIDDDPDGLAVEIARPDGADGADGADMQRWRLSVADARRILAANEAAGVVSTARAERDRLRVEHLDALLLIRSSSGERYEAYDADADALIAMLGPHVSCTRDAGDGAGRAASLPAGDLDAALALLVEGGRFVGVVEVVNPGADADDLSGAVCNLAVVRIVVPPRRDDPAAADIRPESDNGALARAGDVPAADDAQGRISVPSDGRGQSGVSAGTRDRSSGDTPGADDAPGADADDAGSGVRRGDDVGLRRNGGGDDTLASSLASG